MNELIFDLKICIRQFVLGLKCIEQQKIYNLNTKGEKCGEFKWWFKNGQIECDYNYKDGKLHGEFNDWYENGQINCDRNYKDGKLHGNCKSWYTDGQLRFDRNYKDGKLV